MERSYTTQMKNSHARAAEKKLRVTSATADCALKIQGQEDSNTILQIHTNQITLSYPACLAGAGLPPSYTQLGTGGGFLF